MGLEGNAGVASSIDSAHAGPQPYSNSGPQFAGTSKAAYQNSDSIVVRKNTLMASTGSQQEVRHGQHAGGHQHTGHRGH